VPYCAAGFCAPKRSVSRPTRAKRARK
jgi:hypothetical protein